MPDSRHYAKDAGNARLDRGLLSTSGPQENRSPENSRRLAILLADSACL